MNLEVASAYSYLASLIWMPPGQALGLDGVLVNDHGWCCSDHARILALALKMNGVDCFVAEGSMVIHFGLSFPVEPHYFVIDRAGLIYDSSVQHVRVSGIYLSDGARQFKNTCTLHHPGANLDLQFRSSQGVDAFLDYVIKSTYQPEDLALRESVTAYGDMLTAENFHHQHFWCNAATVTASLLSGRLIMPTDLLPPEVDGGIAEKSARRRKVLDWTNSLNI